MQNQLKHLLIATTVWALSSVASAQSADEARARGIQHFFIEANGAYGVQIGETEYLPSGTLGDFQYPLVHGPAFGATAGVMLAPNLALIGGYQYRWATSPQGELNGIIRDIRGTVDYHTADLGLRLYAPVGFGRLRAEMAAGVVAPFHTRLEVTHGSALSQLPVPITGVGSRVENYSVGFGGHAAFGYELPLHDRLYLAFDVRYELFQTESSGERTELSNFITDYSAAPPTATTADIEHGTGDEGATTYSVQSARVGIALGGGF